MKISTIVMSLVSTSMLLACGGNSSVAQDIPVTGSPQIIPVANTPETINGIVVPPDPGAAKDATLAGVDTDGNGIRDEIDRWIATKYGDKPEALEAIRMVARSDQKLMISSPISQTAALAIVYESMDVGGCVGGKLRRESLIAGKVFNESMVRTYNTRERIDARTKVFSIAGMIIRNVDDTTISCPYTR